MLRLIVLSTLMTCGISFTPWTDTRGTHHVRRRARAHVHSASIASDETSSVGVAVDDDKTSLGGTKVAVIICPAQFCVPEDYRCLIERLSEVKREKDEPLIGTSRVAPLPRTEWIKVARNLPTKEFLDAKLPVFKTLKWYFEAIETAAAEIFAEEGDGVRLCLVGHSIGGWVARAYLGGLSRSSTAVHELIMEKCSSLITLGTPHSPPDDALVDQTRGLLREVEEAAACQPQALADRGISVTCVCSNGLAGKFLTTDVEQLVAASSYLPLLGRIADDVSGDGIVPLDLAFMESPSKRVVLDQCEVTKLPVRHSHVVPTPWNLLDGYAPSIELPDDYPSYVSEGALSQWTKYIQ